MADADEDGVDRVAAGAGEAVSFEEAVGFGMADDRFDAALRRSSRLTVGDRWPGLCETWISGSSPAPFP